MKATKSEKAANKSRQQSRKQVRKAKRLDKKAKRSAYYHNRNKSANSHGIDIDIVHRAKTQRSKSRANVASDNQSVSVIGAVEREKRAANQLRAEMKKQRGKQLIDANFEEDKHIRNLEKQLKLNKRKSKTVPKTFAADGLDYLLEVCDTECRKDIMGREIDMDDTNYDFDEDFNLMLGKESGIERKQMAGGDEEFELASVSSGDQVSGKESGNHMGSMQPNQLGPKTWQDIYGRLRDSDGNVIQEEGCLKVDEDFRESAGKYVPPAARALEGSDSGSTRLRRRLKGLVNRLAESNMHSIASEIEALYASNSRHDMNATLSSMMFENIVVNTTCPERLLLEHVLLVAILHANIGSEVGAFFLQNAVHKYSALSQESAQVVEDKRLDNVVTFIAQLYNFKLFTSHLLHEILAKLADKFEEKHVECILNVLRSVGFTLRKDDPSALKALIQCLQAKAASDLSHDSPRVKFMLEVLLAIKNNNFSKIPNYDTSYSEHLKKISKTFIRRGNYVTPLRISFDDLLEAEGQGKWWVVGSAWAGKREGSRLDGAADAGKSQDAFSRKFLELAKKQRMNTETRKHVFCIIVSAEDYMDAFEKLLHLGLKSQQEREIVNVLLHCCLSEKVYNPYYALLSHKFCAYDRRFQMIIKYSIWDKLQALADCSPTQISHLAKLLTHLFLESGLPISTLKSVQFGELDKVTLRFMRQILLGIMLTPNADQCREVFIKVSLSANLKVFRESLRLFVHHFLLRNLNKDGASQLDAGQKALLSERAKMLDGLLTANGKKREQT